ncbi:MAG TPA: Ig-like domain-containing protein, partial [Gemmatimonadales bacterium]|nr:Ig-like domain-containing protein [Gemmatimonadales bacterium]
MRLSVVLALLQQPAAPAQAPFPIAKVVVTPPAGEIQVGQTVRLSAQALDSAGKPVAGSKVAWFAGGTEGSVDSTGLVTGGYSGHVRVYAVGLVPGQNGQKVTEVVITVLPEPPARVVVTPAPAKLLVGTHLTLVGTAYSKHEDVRHDPVTFVSSNPRVAAVTPDGAVHALAAGRATITAAAGPATATLPVQVVANTIVKLAVEPAATSVRTGDVVRFTAQAKDAAGKAVRDVAVQWSLTAGPGVAQLDPQGAFVAELPGSYTVTASVGARSSDAVVRVEQRRVTRGIEVRAHLPIKFSSAEVWMHPSGKCVYLTTIADRVYVIDVSDWTAPKIVDSMLTNARIVN